MNQQALDTRLEARKAIKAGYIKWSKARLTYDRTLQDSMLAPDFWAQVFDKRETREGFLDLVSTRSQVKLIRFDSKVQTVTLKDGIWIAVITEKIEVERKDDHGNSEKRYAMWVTEDGWRHEDNNWLIVSTTALGYEQFREKPPIKGW